MTINVKYSAIYHCLYSLSGMLNWVLNGTHKENNTHIICVHDLLQDHLISKHLSYSDCQFQQLLQHTSDAINVNTKRLLLGLQLTPANLHNQIWNEMCTIHSYTDLWNRKCQSTPCEQASLLAVDQQVAFQRRHLLLLCQKYPAHHTNVYTNLSLNCQCNVPKDCCFSISGRRCTFNTFSPSL